MRIEPLLVQYFYNTKQVSLQGVGTFRLSSDFIMPAATDKEMVMPTDTISFEYNLKTPQDDALIDYIVQQTRKIRPLAASDLESYTMLGSQFLNIGKPFIIEGIGMLEKNQPGAYQFFQQGQFITTKPDEVQAPLREKSEEAVSFSGNPRPTVNRKKVIAVIGILAVTALAAIGAWFFLKKEKPAAPVVKTEPAPVIIPITSAADTIKIDTTKKDTTKAALPIRPDSLSLKPVTNTGNYTFKVVIKNYNSLAAAQKSYNRLTSYGYQLLLYTTDSITYKVAMPFTRPLSDTLYTKDSVRKSLFGGKPYIELK
jgi:hypothetical protein